MKWAYVLGLSLVCVSQAQAAYQLPNQKLASYQCGDACDHLSHEPIHAEWSISDHSLEHAYQHVQKSYRFQKKVTLAELQQGVEINTLGPKAIIRVSPITGKTMPKLELQKENQNRMSFEDASLLYSQDSSLMESIEASPHQTLLQLKEELGSGSFKLTTKERSLKSDATFMINVYDKYSNVYMSVETDKNEYKTHEELIATFTLSNAIDKPIKDMKASIIAPDGETLPFELTKVGPYQYKGKAFLYSRKNDHGANWYIDAEMTAWANNTTIKRHGSVAFLYAIPSAKLISIEKVSNKNLKFKAKMKVINNSRYALQAVLYHEDAQGLLHPVSTSQTASWLERGEHDIEFALDKPKSTDYDSNSLYIGYLHVIDYGQLKTVYHYDQPVKLSELG